MKQPLVIATVFLITAGASMNAWQDRPDFSGSWKVSPAKGDSPAPPPPPPPPPPPSGGPPAPPAPPRLISMVIVQSATELRIDRTMATAERSAVYKFVYKFDGTETTNQMGPIALKSKVSWDGPKLVLSNAYSADDRPLGDSIEKHTLDGATLIIESTRNAPIGVIKSRTVLTKER